MLAVGQIVAAAAVFVATHFAMGFINSSAGGSGGSLLFPSATTPTRWAMLGAASPDRQGHGCPTLVPLDAPPGVRERRDESIALARDRGDEARVAVVVL